MHASDASCAAQTTQLGRQASEPMHWLACPPARLTLSPKQLRADPNDGVQGIYWL